MTENTSGSPERPATSKGHAAERIASQVAYGMLATGVVIALVVIARYSSGALGATDLATIVDRHGPAVLGIPTAAILAFFLVSLARALDGPMALELFGIKSEGGSATCIVWVALFLAIGVCFRALWYDSNDRGHRLRPLPG
jgi:hypothetical protein